ncbi:MAG TPA: hypothetical protein VE860_26245 [Chthoniobacterales bacterium]|jgi:hypothetical protein|nr:hypothetical protein [Chthoniobacterales bacterium]
MKQLIAGGLVLVLIAIGLLLWRRAENSVPSAQIVPAECLLYIEVPNVAATVKRWGDTAISQILEEPSVQHFFEKPISTTPASWAEAWHAFTQLKCKAFFLGVTEPEGNRWICGLQTSAAGATSDRAIENLSKALFSSSCRQYRPDDLKRSDVTSGNNQMQPACMKIGSWILMSRSIELLRAAAANFRTRARGLQSDSLFHACLSNVPSHYDLLTFIQGTPSIDSSRGFHWRYPAPESPRESRAVLAVTTIEGARLRDTVFTYTGGSPAAGRLDREALSLTDPSTIGYLASRVGFSEIWRWCSRFSGQSALAELIRNYLGEAKGFGIDPGELDKLVSGAEIILDRDASSDSVSAAASLQVVDPEKFQRLVDEIVSEKFADNANKKEIAAIPAYSLRVNRNASIVFGLVNRHFLVSGSDARFADLVNRLRKHAPGLENQNEFKEVENLVHGPEDLFLYCDTKAFFEWFYGVFRPMLALGIGLIPAVSKHVDPMALPETDEIAKHLTPVVLSRRHVSDGFIDESVGPVTAYEAAAVMMAGAVAMGVPEH